MDFEITPRGEIPLTPTPDPSRLRPFSGVDTLIAHWVGGYVIPNLTIQGVKSLLRALQASALREGYADIEYNFAIDDAGRIWELRGWKWQSGANGTVGYNAHAIAVVYLAGQTKDGAKVTPLTAKARLAFMWLCQEAARRHSLLVSVIPHRKVIASKCPGDELAAFCPTLQANLRPVKPTPDTEEDMIILQPGKGSSSDPAYVTLDRVKRVVTLHGGATLQEPAWGGVAVAVPSPTALVGWAPTSYGFVIVNVDEQKYHYHWKP